MKIGQYLGGAHQKPRNRTPRPGHSFNAPYAGIIRIRFNGFNLRQTAGTRSRITPVQPHRPATPNDMTTLRIEKTRPPVNQT
jgi:hypothetical protein